MTQPLSTTPAAAGRATGAEGPAEIQAEDLLNRAREFEAEQTAWLETAAVETRYAAALAVQVQAKQEQVERIEDRLEELIEQQEGRLQQIQARPPGWLALPGTRAKWQQQQQNQQTTLQRLQGRLDSVREIKEGMGLHSPRIEELAARKLRAEAPELVAEWDDFRQTQRQHQAWLRAQQQRGQRREPSLETAPKLSLRLERSGA